MLDKTSTKSVCGRGATSPAVGSAEAPSQASGTPILCHFDADDLVERLMGSEDIARRVAAAFVHTMPRQLVALANGINSFDAKATAFAAHSIKGAAANVGTEAIRDLAAKLEQMGRSGALATAHEVLPVLTAAFEAVRPAIERFCGDEA